MFRNLRQRKDLVKELRAVQAKQRVIQDQVKFIRSVPGAAEFLTDTLLHLNSEMQDCHLDKQAIEGTLGNLGGDITQAEKFIISVGAGILGTAAIFGIVIGLWYLERALNFPVFVVLYGCLFSYIISYVVRWKLG